MARKVVTITTLIDDLDGTTLNEGEGETVRFGLDGADLEVDLSTANAEALRELLRPYVRVARKTARVGTPAARSSRSSKEDLSAVRAWLRDQGHKVSERGRIPNQLMELYRTKG